MDISYLEKEIETMKAEQWLKKITSQSDLPVLPQIVFNIDQMIRDENASVVAVSKAIESEPVMTGRLLKLANSALFGGGRQTISSVQMAVGRLGLKRVREVIYTLELPNLFVDTGTIDHFQFWKHAMAVAILARKISQLGAMAQDIQEMCYLAGLMHDLGILVFAQINPAMYQNLLKKIGSDDQLQGEELEAFGVDHAEMGSEFIKHHWRAEEAVVNAIRDHHTPPFIQRNAVKVSSVVYAANAVANKLEYHNGVKAKGDPFGKNTFQLLGLKEEKIDELFAEVKDLVQQAEFLLGY